MATTVQHKRSETTGAEPVAGDILVGEIAVNLTDGKLFSKKSDGTVVTLAGNLTATTYYIPTSLGLITEAADFGTDFGLLTQTVSNGNTQDTNTNDDVTFNTVTTTGNVTVGGSVTMPNRPAFRVIGNGGAISATTTMTSSHFTVDYNQGSALNTTTGIFTAPIAGLYQVNLVVRTNSNTSGTISQAIVRKTAISGGAVTTQIMVEFGANTTMNHTGGSTIVKMAVGDTLKVDVTAGTLSFDGNDNWSVAYIG